MSVQCHLHGQIDNVLRSYLAFTSEYKCKQDIFTDYKKEITNARIAQYLHTTYEFARCSFTLLESPIFAAHKEYVRTQIIFSLLQVQQNPNQRNALLMMLGGPSCRKIPRIRFI